MPVSTDYNYTKPATVSRGGVITERRNIEVITAEIRFYKNQAGEAILEIGNRLNEAKEQLEHGEWLDWLEEKVDFSDATAQRFMRLAREYSDPSLVTELGSSKALALLALPPADREEFIESSHEVDGEEKTVNDMSKRELEKAVKERADAIKAKEAAERIARETEEELEALKLKFSDARSQAETAAEEVERIQTDKKALEEELDSLKKSDAPLPDEEGQQMMEAMRKEIAAEAKKDAEKKLKSKIEKADVDKEKAERALKDAVEANGRLNLESENIKRQQEAKIAQLQKQLAAASSESVTVFKTHFDNAQGCINSMVGCLIKLKDEPATRDKLASALRALCEKTIQNLPAPEKEAAESAK